MMILNTKFKLTFVAITLTIASVLSNVDAVPGPFSKVKYFYGYFLDGTDPFAQNNVEITEISGSSSSSAIGMFKNNKIMVTCIPENKPAKQLHDKLLHKVINNESGKKISYGPIHAFSVAMKASTCYVTDYRCDQKLVDYGRGLFKKYDMVSEHWHDFGKGFYRWPKIDEAEQKKIDTFGLKVVENIKDVLLAIRRLGWHVNRDLGDVCINDNGNAISFVQFEKAYTVSSVEKRSKGTYNEVKEANEHITGIMQSVFVPADGKSLSSCIRDGIDQPLLEIKRAICKTIKELLIPQPIQ